MCRERHGEGGKPTLLWALQTIAIHIFSLPGSLAPINSIWSLVCKQNCL